MSAEQRKTGWVRDHNPRRSKPGSRIPSTSASKVWIDPASIINLDIPQTLPVRVDSVAQSHRPKQTSPSANTTSSRRPPPEQSRRGPPVRQNAPSTYIPRPVSPSVIDFSELRGGRDGGPPSPPESVYPDHEPNPTISWLQIANLGFAKHAASIVEHTKLDKGRAELAEDLEYCELTKDAWKALELNLHAAEDTMTKIMEQADREAEAAGFAYMMNRHMKLHPSERWTSGLVSLPERNPDYRVYSSLATLAVYGTNPSVNPQVLNEARKIVIETTPASIYERSRLVLSVWDSMIPVLQQYGYRTDERYIKAGVHPTDWSRWKVGTDDVLINRHFPEMAETLTNGRASFIPPSDRLNALRSMNHQEPDDIFAKYHPHNPPSASRSNSRGWTQMPQPNTFRGSQGSEPLPSARQRTTNPSNYSGNPQYAPRR